MSELETTFRVIGAFAVIFIFYGSVIWFTIRPPKFIFLCRWFGHKIGGGYYRREGGEYFDIRTGAIDGINRIHCDLYTTCERCNIRYQVGRCHLPYLTEYESSLVTKERDK